MKVNSATPLAAGTQVMFWQQGTINDANGVSHPVWWLLDNDVIGTDGLAHTASQSYTGITTGGNILVTGTAVPEPNPGAETIKGSILNFNAIWAQEESIAIAPTLSMAIAALGLFSGMSDLVGVSYTIQGSYQLQLPGQAVLPNSTISLPAPPDLPVTIPAITGVQYDVNSRQLTITRQNQYRRVSHRTASSCRSGWCRPKISGERRPRPARRRNNGIWTRRLSHRTLLSANGNDTVTSAAGAELECMLGKPVASLSEFPCSVLLLGLEK